MAAVSGFKPLTSKEFEKLEALLVSRGGARAMRVEELDGFFTALVIGPDMVMPSEYLPVVWGGDDDESAGFKSLEEANVLMQLMMRHWNAIVAELEAEGVYRMKLDAPDTKGVPGRQWARGFMKGVTMRREGWSVLLTSENEGQLATIAIVAGDVDPGFPEEPLDIAAADRLVVLMAAGVGRAYRYFKAQRVPMPGGRREKAGPVRRREPKVGRNEPCPCGSGRKYKQCCGRDGGPTLH